MSLPGHLHAGADPRWKIPPAEWDTVLQRVEEGEPLRHIARDYGVSYEAVRRVLRAARRHSVGHVSTDQPQSPGEYATSA